MQSISSANKTICLSSLSATKVTTFVVKQPIFYQLAVRKVCSRVVMFSASVSLFVGGDFVHPHLSIMMSRTCTVRCHVNFKQLPLCTGVATRSSVAQVQVTDIDKKRQHRWDDTRAKIPEASERLLMMPTRPLIDCCFRYKTSIVKVIQ